MRIFVLGAGASGSFLAQLLARQGHRITCGDKDPERARRFLGKKSALTVVPTNARNVRSVVRAARGCHLLVNAAPAKFNETVLRAALHLRAHYLDLSAHMVRHPFKAEQLAYSKRFAGKRRAALITAGVAPGLTNLLAARASEMLDHVEAMHIRLYESTDGDDPFSQWSAEGSFDEPRPARAWCATAASASPSASANASASAFRHRLARSAWFWRRRMKWAPCPTASR